MSIRDGEHAPPLADLVAETIPLVRPAVRPPLDAAFRPAALAHRAFEQAASEDGVPLVIGLERDGSVTRFQTRVFPEGHPHAGANLRHAERLVKFLLWQRGGSTVFVGGPRCLGEHVQRGYSRGGARDFDVRFMEQVYERPFKVVSCSSGEVPPAQEAGRPLGRHLDGCRIGFDLGASDRKVSALVDGTVVYSEEVVWEPARQSDPEYHYREVVAALRTAASKLPRVDAIGGSSAGVFVDSRPMVASLFRGVPPERYGEVRNLFHRIRDEMGVPLEVINDGDVTALAGSMALADNGVLGIAMGSSEAAGYVDVEGRVVGWLNELSFAPIDYDPAGPVEEWSGDTGCGSQYLSQQGLFRLAGRAGIPLPEGVGDADRLRFLQQRLDAGDEAAADLWRTLGVYLGYALAHYASFYDIRHVLILGRCVSGGGGLLALDEATAVLRSEFPELAARIQVQLPDERSRRVGQSIAAASLPQMRPRAADGAGHMGTSAKTKGALGASDMGTGRREA
jgi:predicted NBD/HSP70 family sugar kinase